MKCRDCGMLERFKGGEFFNKCAFFDIWNLDIDEEHECAYFKTGIAPDFDFTVIKTEKSETVFV